MYLVKAYSRNSGYGLILARKGTFFEKGIPNISPLLFIPFFASKDVYNICKREQCSIVKRNIERNVGLEYTLLAALNAHISTTSSHSLCKSVNVKGYVPAVPMIMSKFWSIFVRAKRVSFYFLAGKNFSFRNLDPHKSRFFLPEQCWFLAWIWHIWKLMEYTNDLNPDSSIIPIF